MTTSRPTLGHEETPVFTSITASYRQQLLTGGPAMLETRRFSSWHPAKANLGIRWRT